MTAEVGEMWDSETKEADTKSGQTQALAIHFGDQGRGMQIKINCCIYIQSNLLIV
jgi:hypothetical protein